MKKLTLALFLIGISTSALFAQTGTRVLGAQQVVLDDNVFSDPRLYLTNYSGSLGIDNTGNVSGLFPSTCAILDLSSTTKGFLPPRMTAAQEAAICGGTPPAGLIVYNTTTNSLDVYSNGIWGSIGWGLSGNTLSGLSSSAPAQFLGSTNNYDLVFRTNNSECFRLGSTGASGVATLTMSPTSLVGLQINGNAQAFNGINIDMTTNPVKTVGGESFCQAISGSITGISGAMVVGSNLAATSTNANSFGIIGSSVSNGSGSSFGLSGNSASYGSGTSTAIAGSALGLGTSNSGVIGGDFTAQGSGNSLTVIGVSGFAAGNNNQDVVGGTFSAQGSTGNNIGVKISLSAGGATDNIGENFIVSGTNPTNEAINAYVFGGTDINLGFAVTADGTSGNSAFGCSATAYNAPSQNIAFDAHASGAHSDAFRSNNTSNSTQSNGLHIANTAGGTITNGVNVENTGSGQITNGIQIQNTSNGTIQYGTYISNGDGGSMITGIGIQSNGAGSFGTGLQISTNAGGSFSTAISTGSGRLQWGSSGPSYIASGGNIPTTAVTVVVGDNGVAASAATATMPAGLEGQILYISTDDPDGVKFTSGANTVTIPSWQIGTFMYVGGKWRLSR